MRLASEVGLSHKDLQIPTNQAIIAAELKMPIEKVAEAVEAAPTDRGAVARLEENIARMAKQKMPVVEPPKIGLSVEHVTEPERPAPEPRYESPDPAIEAGFRETAAGVPKKPKSVISTVTEGLTYIGHAMTRLYAVLPRGPKFARANAELRLLREEPSIAAEKAVRYLKHITDPLPDAESFDVFRRKTVLLDLAHSADRGEPLPFGWTPEQVRAELGRIEAESARRPEVAEAEARRREVWDSVKTDYINAMEAMGFPVTDRLDREDYFHHQVIDRMRADRVAESMRGVKLPTGRGFLKERQGVERAISTNYLQAEFEVLSGMLHDKVVAESLKRIEEEYDASAALKQEARARNFENLVGGPEVVGHIRQLEAELQTAKRARAAELRRELGELDPTRPYKQRIATGLNKLRRSGALGEVQEFSEDLPAELARIIGQGAPEDKRAAGMVFKAISEREAMIRERLGDDYLEWRRYIDPRVIPTRMKTYQPWDGNLLYRAKAITEEAFDRIFGSLTGDPQAAREVAELAPPGPSVSPEAARAAGLTEADFRDVLVLGGKRREWVIPAEVADALNAFVKERANDPASKLDAMAMSAWKQMVTFVNPKRAFMYNLRNLSGDAEMLFVGNPSAFRYVPAAARELYEYHVRGQPPSPDLEMWLDSGGAQGLLQVAEMGDIDRLKQFVRFLDKHKPTPTEKFGDVLRAYWRTMRFTTDFRESLLRYACFKDYQHQCLTNNGVPLNFGASDPDVIMALDPKERPFKLTNELMGAYDQVSQGGRVLRARVHPFWSWVEINIGRNIRLMRNALREGRTGDVGGRAAALVPLKVARSAYALTKLGAKASALWTALTLWNNLMYPDEEKSLPEDVRGRMHIVLGRNPDGTVAYIGRLGAISDFLEWFGVDAPATMVQDFLNGRIGPRDIVGKAIRAPINKEIQGLHPAAKLAAELAARQTFYPDVFDPGRLRDAPAYIARQFTVEEEFRKLTGRPSEPYLRSLQRIFSQINDPEEAAYHDIISRKYDFLREHGRIMPRGVGAGSPKEQALYNYRQARYLGDNAAAQKYLGQYLKAGGTRAGLTRAIDAVAPLAGLGPLRAAFLKSLTPEEREEKLPLAARYHARLRRGPVPPRPAKQPMRVGK